MNKIKEALNKKREKYEIEVIAEGLPIKIIRDKDKNKLIKDLESTIERIIGVADDDCQKTCGAYNDRCNSVCRVYRIKQSQIEEINK